MNNKHNIFKKLFAGLLAAACLITGTVCAYADDKTVGNNEIEMGDVNNDGKVDALDALQTLRYTVGLDKIYEQYLSYADFDDDGKITSADALFILRKSVNLGIFHLDFPDQIKVNCGDRISLNARILPESQAKGVTLNYTLDTNLSTDGSGERVIQYTNTGKVKAFHPGISTITVKASNGITETCKVTVEDNITNQTVTVGENTLSVTKHIMTKNDAYNETEDFTHIDGIVIHSTATPGAKADIWYNAWNKPYTDVAVHAFLDDVGVYQYLPFEQIAWHAGQPANNRYIDFEICEPSGFTYTNNVITGYNVAAQQEYFNKIWKNSTVYTAYLCTEYGLTADDILSHAEVGIAGLGTAHGDPDHWFIMHNKTMDDFRNEVRNLMRNDNIHISEPQIIKNTTQSSSSDFFSDNTNVTPFDMFKVWGNDSLRY